MESGEAGKDLDYLHPLQNDLIVSPTEVEASSQLTQSREVKAREEVTVSDPVLVLAEFVAEVKSTARVSLEFALLWFGSNYFYNLGLDKTAVSSSTVLANTSSIFVYIFSLILMGGHKFSLIKVAVVTLSFSGIMLITLTDDSSD
jgi:hypothetical protein